MLSLNNGYSEEEIKAFLKLSKTFKDFKILAETKVDGLSASLIYQSPTSESINKRRWTSEDITTNITCR